MHHINRLKKTNYMIISIDIEKIWQYSTPIHDKNSQKNRDGGEHPQLGKEYV